MYDGQLGLLFSQMWGRSIIDISISEKYKIDWNKIGCKNLVKFKYWIKLVNR